MKSEQLSELESLVESIKQGQRVVFFPPGIAAFIAVNLLLIASFITLFAPIMSIMGSDWEMGQKAGGQFFVILLAIGCIVPPALFITRGRKNLRRWFTLLSSTLAFAAAIMVIIGMLMDIQALQNQAPPLYVCIITSSFAAFLTQSTSYQLLVQFYYLIYKK